MSIGYIRLISNLPVVQEAKNVQAVCPMLGLTEMNRLSSLLHCLNPIRSIVPVRLRVHQRDLP